MRELMICLITSHLDDPTSLITDELNHALTRLLYNTLITGYMDHFSYSQLPSKFADELATDLPNELTD